MKMIPLKNGFINLDKIEQIDENNNLIFESGNKIKLTDEELEMFIHAYNLYDTDEIQYLVRKSAEVLFNNPMFMTEEGLRNDITLKIERYNLKEFAIKFNNGKKFKELNHKELVALYKALVEKVYEEYPF